MAHIASVKTKEHGVHAHKLVAQTAREMCYELYDTLMGENVWYDEWKRQNSDTSDRRILELRFVRKNWARLLPVARAMLAQMLTGTTDEALKATIYDALLLDNTLKRGRPRHVPFSG